MPKLLFARAPRDEREEHDVRRLASAGHAPGDWIQRARFIVANWDGLRLAHHRAPFSGQVGLEQLALVRDAFTLAKES